MFTQEVVAYRVAKNACLPLVTDMLTEAISKLKPNSKPTQSQLYIAIKVGNIAIDSIKKR
ncbi:hypothetical protein CWO07_14040 [Vibrio splendidus]|uniref:Uncharacterized protein n=1 Tax=Vibrio splendidus TaxID=29497 RepID=A0A2T5EU64_VIBSP|nr:hypothetical protein CWO07_14040 [Vibrio splendidus]